MAIKPVLQYRNPDSTLDLNSSQSKIIDSAIFDGGTLTLSTTSTQVTVAPFIVAGYDGMVAISNAAETVSVPDDGTDYYLILHLEYRTLTAPIVNLQVVPSSTWTSSVSKKYFVTFAKFNVPLGATVSAGSVDYSVGDWADKLGKTGWRSPVANFAALPLEGNRDGDTRITIDTYTSYAWQAGSSTWTVVGGALDLGEVVARGHEMDAEELRAFNGSGYVGSLNIDPLGRLSGGTYGRIPYITQSTAANRIDLDAMHFVVNGHFVKTPYTELTLGGPLAVESHDLVYLDVWREQLATPPSAETYPTDPITLAPYTFSQLRSNLETLLEDSPNPNSGFSKIEAVDATTFVVTRWAIRFASNVLAGSIMAPSVAAGSAVNVDGTSYTTSALSDKRVWTAASFTPYDGISWAIPLMVVRRTPSEIGPASYIKETRSDTFDQRFIFDVCPRAELGDGFTAASAALEQLGNTPEPALDSPSGFLTGTGTKLTSTVSGFVAVPASKVLVSGTVLDLSSSQVPLTPNSASGKGLLDLIYLEIHKTSNPPGNVSSSSSSLVVRGDERGISKVGYYGKFVVEQLVDVPTEFAAMSAAASGAFSAVSSDPGLWSRAAVAGAEDSPGVWAIPVALVSRRTTSAYDPRLANGRSGTVFGLAYIGLPKNPADMPYDYEILDLRHRLIGVDDADRVLQESRDKLLRGDLRTKFGHDITLGGSFYGTQLMAVDEISATPTAGSYPVTPVPNGHTAIWSDAEEAQPLCWAFTNPMAVAADATVSYPGAPKGTVFDWKPGTPGTLIISAPAGMHLSFVDPASSQVSSPGLRTVVSQDTAPASVTAATVYFITSSEHDVDGNLVSVTLDVPLGGTPTSFTKVFVQLWAVKSSRASLVPLSTYTSNFGLSEVPDIVYRVDDGNDGPNRINVGPILAKVRVVVNSGTATITQTMVDIAYSELASAFGQINILGVSSYSVVGLPATDFVATPNLRYVSLSDGSGAPGFSEMVLTFQQPAIPDGSLVDVFVMCEGDYINTWVEVNRASKGVRGLYSWVFSGVSASATGGGVVASHPKSTFGPGFHPNSCLVPFSEVGLSVLGMRSSPKSSNIELSATCLVYSHTAPAYTYWTDSADLVAVGQLAGSTFAINRVLDQATSLVDVVGPWTSFLGVHFTGATPGASLTLIGVVRTPLAVSDHLRLFYLYTPYQGISTEVPSPSDMKDYLHGTVEAVANTVVTSQGPNTPFVSTDEITESFGGLTSFVYESGVVDIDRFIGLGHPLSSGRAASSARRLARTSLVRPDTVDYTGRPTDSYLSSPLYNFPVTDLEGTDFSLYQSSTVISPGAATESFFYRAPLLSAINDTASLPWAVTYNDATFGTYTSNPAPGDTLLVPLPGLPRGLSTSVWVAAVHSGPLRPDVTVTLLRRGFLESVSTVVSSAVVPAYFSDNKESWFAKIDDDADYFLAVTSSISGTKLQGVYIGMSAVDYFSSLGLCSRPYFFDYFSSPVSLGASSTPPYPAGALSDFYTSYAVASRRGVSLVGVSGAATPGSYFFSPGGGSDESSSRSWPFFTGSLSSYSDFDLSSRSSSNHGVMVSTPVTSPTIRVVSSLDSWALDVGKKMYIGASSGLNFFSGSKHSTLLLGGTAVDAFYPVGRPLFKKTK